MGVDWTKHAEAWGRSLLFIVLWVALWNLVEDIVLLSIGEPPVKQIQLKMLIFLGVFIVASVVVLCVGVTD